MQSATIPVSFVEEEKEFLGFMSIRQVLYVGPSLIVIYLWMTTFPLPFMTLGTKIFIKVIGAFGIAAIGGLLSFYYLERFEMFFDKYVLLRWTYRKSQKTYHYIS